MYLVTKGTNNDDWLILGGDRLSTNGTSYIDFELLQKSVTRNTSNNKFTSEGTDGGRTVNDLVISMEYSNGGAKPNVAIYRWQLVSPGKYDYVLIPKTTVIPNTGGKTLADFAFAETNRAGTENVPFGAFGSTTYQQYAFVEAAVDMTKLLGTINPCLGINIKTIFIKTKASDSQTAALKDLMEPIQVSINFGGASISYATPFCPVGTASPTYGDGSVQGGTFSAAANPGTTGTMSINQTTGVIDLANTPAGSYTVTYTFTTNGCQKTATAPVLINPKPSITGTLSVCVNGTTSLTGSGTAATTNPWTSSNTSVATVSSSGVVSGVAEGTATITYTNSIGCSQMAIVTVNPNATADAGTAPAAQCYDATNGSTFSLSGSGTNGSPSWAVAPNGNPNNLTVQITNGTTYSPSVKVSGGSGTVTLRLTVTSSYTPSCGTPTSDVSVTVNTKPTANAGTDPSAQCYVSDGNTFNLSGTGSYGNPSWAIAPNGNPDNLTVDITNSTTLTPTVKLSGNANGGTVTIRLTVTSNASPSCGTATDDIILTVNEQVSGPSAEMQPITCADKFFKVKIIGPDAGTTYTLTQPNNSKVFAPITGVFNNNTGKVNDVIFEGLVFGDGYRIVASKNGCESAPTLCEGSVQEAGFTNLKTEQPKISNEASAKVYNQSIYLDGPETKITVAPNPYNDRIRFNFKSAVSGQGSLELYNMMGQKVKTIYQGFIEKDRLQAIEYTVPNAQRSNLIYLFKVGDQRVSGKLIH